MSNSQKKRWEYMSQKDRYRHSNAIRDAKRSKDLEMSPEERKARSSRLSIAAISGWIKRKTKAP